MPQESAPPARRRAPIPRPAGGGGRLAGPAGAIAAWFYCHQADPASIGPRRRARAWKSSRSRSAGWREATVAWTRQLERGLCYAYGCWEVSTSRRPRPVDLVLGRSAGLGSTLFVPASLPAGADRQPVRLLTTTPTTTRPGRGGRARDAARVRPLAALGQRDGPARPGERRHPLDRPPPGSATCTRPSIATTSSSCTTASTPGASPGRGRRAPRDRRPHDPAGDEGRQLRGRQPGPPPRLRPLPRAGQPADPGAIRTCSCIAVGRRRRRADGSTCGSTARTTRHTCSGQTPPRDPSRLWRLGTASQEVVAEVLAASDLHVYPSRPYAVSRSLLEAMASGCVVLAWDADAGPRVPRGRRDRAARRPGDPDAAGEGAWTSSADPAAYRPLGEAAAARGPRAVRPGRDAPGAGRRCSTELRARKDGEHAPMHVLFIHQAFPAQFGRLALELTRAYGWECPS